MNGVVYLGALALLVINDHVLKPLYPNAITGKLSDVAGLFAFAVFLGALIPRRIAVVVAGAFLVYWKSPLSQPLLDALPWEATRAVDWTDLIALAVLPLAYRFRVESMRAPVAALSLFAFAATSVAEQRVELTPETLPPIETNLMFAVAVDRLERWGMAPHAFDGESGPFVWVFYKSSLARRHVKAVARVIETDNRVTFDFFSLGVRGNQSLDDESAYAKELDTRIRSCL